MRGVFTLLLYFIGISTFGQSFIKEYDLDFSSLEKLQSSGHEASDWPWVLGMNSSSFSIDSTTTNKPLSITSTGFKTARGDYMQFQLSKMIIAPEMGKHQGTISVRSKSSEMDKPVFCVTTFDGSENEVFSDSVHLISKDWNTYTFSFELSSIKAIQIEFNYMGNNNTSQNIQLSNLDFLVDGVSITDLQQLDSLNINTNKLPALDEQHIIPLYTKNKTISPQVLNYEDLKNASIIGLGESCHGIAQYDSIYIQLTKDLIEKSNCRLILQELPICNLLTTDLYIQGVISDKYKDLVQASISLANRDYKFYWEFYTWLREFNQNREDKVHLIGMDIEDGGYGALNFSNSLGSYFLALSEVDDRIDYKDYLRNARDGDDVFIYELALNDNRLKERVGEDNYRILLYALKRKLLAKEHELERDRKMYIQAKGLIDQFMCKGQKTLIFAHNGHVGNGVPNLNRIRGVKQYMMGYYMKEVYGSEYFIIASESGRGTFFQDKGHSLFSTQFVDTLQVAPIGSFVHEAIKTNHNSFFYPTKHLNNNFYKTQYLFRRGRFSNQYIFTIPQVKFDAYVFSRNSVPHNNIFLERTTYERFNSLTNKIRKLINEKMK